MKAYVSMMFNSILEVCSRFEKFCGAESGCVVVFLPKVGVWVQGRNKVLIVNSEEVLVLCEKKKIRIAGSCLAIENASGAEIVVAGKVETVEEV